MSFGDDRRWLAVLAVTTLLEIAWWSIARAAGIAPLPLLGAYAGFAVAGLSAALLLGAAIGRTRFAPPWRSLLAGTLLVALGASFFLPLKYSIPREVPFWLDMPLANLERALFGADPWLLLDAALGWATLPMDRIYGFWLPVQTLFLFIVMTQPPSAEKSRALIAYSLAWFVLGVLAATLLSSGGPIFYDRLFGGGEFAGLRETLQARHAWVVLAESDAMWASLAETQPGLVAGISAVPSLHVAISLWMALTARTMAPRLAPFAFAYFIFIWVASVQLGWHYASDGLAGAAGMAAIWALSSRLDRFLEQPVGKH